MKISKENHSFLINVHLNFWKDFYSWVAMVIFWKFEFCGSIMKRVFTCIALEEKKNKNKKGVSDTLFYWRDLKNFQNLNKPVIKRNKKKKKIKTQNTIVYTCLRLQQYF